MREVPTQIAARLTDAVDAFATSFEDLRMDDIARASGIPRATLYYYFAGKDDLLAFLFDTLLAEFRAALAEAPGPALGARDQLTELLRRFLAQLATRPAAAQLLLVNLGRAGKLPDISAGVREALAAPFERVLAAGMARGELRRADPATTATALFGSVTIVGLDALVTGGTLDAAALGTRLADLFWAGIAATPAGPGGRQS